MPFSVTRSTFAFSAFLPAASNREAARNPLMVRGNAGAVAFRNLYLKELE
jgi:hypothetical protein